MKIDHRKMQNRHQELSNEEILQCTLCEIKEKSKPKKAEKQWIIVGFFQCERFP